MRLNFNYKNLEMKFFIVTDSRRTFAEYVWRIQIYDSFLVPRLKPMKTTMYQINIRVHFETSKYAICEI